MRRRDFIAGFSIATLGPFAAFAQQSERIRRIGVLLGATTEHDPEGEARIAAFRHGLEELGWVDGHNIHIDYRFAAGDPDLIRTYVRELVTSAPDPGIQTTSAQGARASGRSADSGGHGPAGERH